VNKRRAANYFLPLITRHAHDSPARMRHHLAENRFRSVLNVRAIAMRRELKDRDLKFHECVATRHEVHNAWFEVDRAYCLKESRETIRLKDEVYFTALQKLTIATKRRIKQISMLQSNLTLVKAALKRY
jgi:hypothetical protein